MQFQQDGIFRKGRVLHFMKMGQEIIQFNCWLVSFRGRKLSDKGSIDCFLIHLLSTAENGPSSGC
ncbi:MAG: hypothetical protein CMQ19_03245 [Gammaproteobacteria bacterium]|nr:hypothetical protein [Gammaproteobacteria bacterium]